MNTKTISDGLEAAIKDPSLQDTTASLAEVFLDASISDGVLRDIPFVGTILGLSRAAISISDRIFLNKLIHMLTEIDSVPVEQRRQLVEEIDKSEKLTLKVGEKLIYIIDRCEDHLSSKIVGRLFRAYLEGRLSYSDFLRLSFAVDRLHYSNLLIFLDYDRSSIPAEEAGHYLGTGLFDLDPLYIRVVDQDDWKASEKYKIEGGEITASITSLGQKLRSILSSIKVGKNENGA